MQVTVPAPARIVSPLTATERPKPWRRRQLALAVESRVAWLRRAQTHRPCRPEPLLETTDRALRRPLCSHPPIRNSRNDHLPCRWMRLVPAVEPRPVVSRCAQTHRPRPGYCSGRVRRPPPCPRSRIRKCRNRHLAPHRGRSIPAGASKPAAIRCVQTRRPRPASVWPIVLPGAPITAVSPSTATEKPKLSLAAPAGSVNSCCCTQTGSTTSGYSASRSSIDDAGSHAREPLIAMACARPRASQERKPA